MSTPTRDVWILQLQQDTKKALRLTATFQHTLAICIWQSFPAHDVGVMNFWQSAAVLLAEQANWFTLRLVNEKALANFIALGPADAAPEDLVLTDGEITTPGWAAVTTPARPVLLLVQGFLQMAMKDAGGQEAEACIKAAVKQMHSNMNQIRLRQDSTVPAGSKAAAHIKCLRAALVMLKVLQLLVSLRVRDTVLRMATTTLCTCIQSATNEASQRLCDQSNKFTAIEKQETQTLHLLLVQMVVPVIKQMLKVKSPLANAAHGWGCQMLTDLMPKDSPYLWQAVASKFTSSGAFSFCLYLACKLLACAETAQCCSIG